MGAQIAIISKVLLYAAVLAQNTVSVLAAPSQSHGLPSIPSHGSPSHGFPSSSPDPANFVNVTFKNKVFINKGLVGFGFIPANFRESTGDTFGGVGSAIAIQRGSWEKKRDGSFDGALVVQPDRGFNIIQTVDYQARQHVVKFTLSPYYATTPLSFEDAQKTLRLSYVNTKLYTDRRRTPTTGLDPLAIRPADFKAIPIQVAQPVANSTYNRISFDSEGLVLDRDGSFWVSDEYGPYVHQLNSEGTLIRSIQPPKAILPFQPVPGSNSSVELNFTSVVDPVTGRSGNQGFEGLTVNPSGTRLFVLLQSATIQDGGNKKKTSSLTRFLEYDISNPIKPPVLKAEFVVPLPQNPSNQNTFAQSEMHYLSDTQFLILARDGNGAGGGVGSEESVFKNIDIIDISQATNIANTKFDDPANPIGVKGVIDPEITPAVHQSFLNMIDDTQLARFGLHNGLPTDPTLINSKWESIALAPVEDSKTPDDYFLFTASDNDFLTTDGISVGQPYNAGEDVNSQFLVWRVTLPTVARGSVEQSIGF